MLVPALILSAATLYGKRISQTVDPTVMTGWQLAFGGLVLVGGGYLTGGTLAVHSAAAALVLAYLTLLSSIAFALWSVLLKHNRVSMIAPFNFVVPVAGTVLSAIFLGENILELKYAVALALVHTGHAFTFFSPFLGWQRAVDPKTASPFAGYLAQDRKSVV